MSDDGLPTYIVRRAPPGVGPGPLRWEDPAWDTADLCPVDRFHPSGSDHRPATVARLLLAADALLLRFTVTDDRYVVARATADQQLVCFDSCVEFFVQPRPDRGHLNFEFNCGGTVLASCVDDPTRIPAGFARWRPLPATDLARLAITHSLPVRVDPELPGPITWDLCCRLPLAVLADAVGPLPDQGWRANFYKCADRSSHPHWASWSPIGEQLNFHRPSTFGHLAFAGPNVSNGRSGD